MRRRLAALATSQRDPQEPELELAQRPSLPARKPGVCFDICYVDLLAIDDT